MCNSNQHWSDQLKSCKGVPHHPDQNRRKQANFRRVVGIKPTCVAHWEYPDWHILTVEVAVIIGIIYCFQKIDVIYRVFELFSKLKISSKQWKNLISTSIAKNESLAWLISSKIARCSANKSSREWFIFSFYVEDWPFSRSDLLELSSLRRLWRRFWSNRSDYGKGSIILTRSYHESIQTLDHAMIRLSRPSAQTLQTIVSPVRFCERVADHPTRLKSGNCRDADVAECNGSSQIIEIGRDYEGPHCSDTSNFCNLDLVAMHSKKMACIFWKKLHQ